MGKENIVFMIEKGKLIYVIIALDMALLHTFMISWYTADIWIILCMLNRNFKAIVKLKTKKRI